MPLHAFTTPVPTWDGPRGVAIVTPYGRTWRSDHRKVAARIRQTTVGKVKRVTDFQHVNCYGVHVVTSYWL